MSGSTRSTGKRTFSALASQRTRVAYLDELVARLPKPVVGHEAKLALCAQIEGTAACAVVLQTLVAAPSLASWEAFLVV